MRRANRKGLGLGLLALLAWAMGLGQDARAGVTVDVVFRDGHVPSGITVAPGEVGPGCAFGGYYNRSTAIGFCMDVMLTTTFDFVAVSASVMYDSDDGLAVQAVYEWLGVWVAKGMGCRSDRVVNDTGSQLNSFDCVLTPPDAPVYLSAGTYRIGTIVWDTSGMTGYASETVGGYINDLFDGMSAVINGNVVELTSTDIMIGSHVVQIVPEPGSAALLGLAFVGLVLAARRCRG